MIERIVAIVVGVAVLAGFGAYSFHRFTESYVADGKAAQLKVDQPIIDKLTADLKTANSQRDLALDANEKLGKDIDQLKLEVVASNETIDRLSKLSNEARATAKRLKGQIDALIAKGAQDDARLRAIAAGAPIADACATADRLMNELAVWVRS